MHGAQDGCLIKENDQVDQCADVYGECKEETARSNKGSDLHSFFGIGVIIEMHGGCAMLKY